MSSNSKPIIIDNTDQEKSSAEAILIIAIVLGFFLSILIGLCISRHRETVKRLLATKESSRGSYSREHVAGTMSMSPRYLESLSTTKGSLELIRNGEMTSLGNAEHAYHLSYPQSASNYWEYESSENVLHRKSKEFMYYDVIQTDDRDSVISPHEMIPYYEYESTYSKASGSISEETFSTSMEKIEDYEPLWTHEDHINREQYDRYNYFPEVRLTVNHRRSGSETVSKSLSGISRSDINLYCRRDQANHHKWQFLGDDNSSSSVSTFNGEKTPPHHENVRRLKGQGRFSAQGVYTDSSTSGERKIPVSIQIPGTAHRGIVDIAVHTPFSEKATSTTMAGGIADSQFARGRRNVLRSSENGPRHPDDFPIIYRNQEAVIGQHGHVRKDDRNPKGLFERENPQMLTSYAVHDAPWSTWMVSEEESSNMISHH